MKYNLVVPLNGRGQRMLDGGYMLPKPLLFAGNKRIIEWSMESIDSSECNVIFIVRKDHCLNYGIDEFLKNKYQGCTVVSAGETGGAIESVLEARRLIDNKTPLIVYCPDIYFEPKFVPTYRHFSPEGFILTFKANSPAYSYVECYQNSNKVKNVVEKEVVSNFASVGIYCFQSGQLFCRAADVSKDDWGFKERYIAPLYNYLGDVIHETVEKIFIMGTPQELEFFNRRCFKFFTQRKFVLCSDHSGYEEKERFRKVLDSKNLEYVDVGNHSTKDCDYVDYVKTACDFVRSGYFGVMFCRSGQGVNLCANKYDCISVIVRDLEDARLGISHNFADCFAVSSGKNAIDYAELCGILLTEKPLAGRFQNRVMKI